MAEADAAARDFGLGRSALIAEALREYLRCRRQKILAEHLNQAYAIADASGDRQLVRKLRTKMPSPHRW